LASSVVSRVAGLGVLTGAGQLLIIGTLPLYSRLFEPGIYGQYVIFIGAFTIASVLAGVRYDTAIVLPRAQHLAAALSVLVLLIALVVSALIAAATLVVSVLKLLPQHWPYAVRQFGYGLAVATTLGAVQRCLNAWCVRAGRFLLIGWGQFVFCLVTVLAQLSLVSVLGQFPALVWGYVGALGCQAVCLGAPVMREGGRIWPRAQGGRAMRIAARKYRRFPAYMVGYALASSARDRLVQMMFGIGAGAAAVGRFGLAYRVTFAPNSLIYSAVSPVFYGIASRSGKAAVGRFAAGLVEVTFVVLVVPYVAFAIEAPALSDAVLSEKWRGTGPYLQALAAPALLLAATCWLDRAFDAFRRQNVAFSLEATFTVVAVASVAVLSKLISAVLVAWAFGALALLYYWVYFLVTFAACGFDLAQFRRACTSALVTLASALLLGLLAHQIPSLAWRVPAYAAVMVLVILLWAKARGGRDVLRLLIESRVHLSPR
jgi:O-antigen/teichoic acid export membrane protein